MKKAIVAALLLTAASSQLPALERTKARAYTVPDHGSLELQVPASWKDDVQQPPDRLPPTITLRTVTGPEIEIHVTPLWSPTSDKGFNDPARVRQLVESDRQEIASEAAEKEIAIVSLEGAEAHGYYFMATDKSPKPGEYEYLVRAGISVGDLLLSTTILSHEKNSAAMQDALAALKNARVIPSGAPATAAAGPRRDAGLSVHVLPKDVAELDKSGRLKWGYTISLPRNKQAPAERPVVQSAQALVEFFNTQDTDVQQNGIWVVTTDPSAYADEQLSDLEDLKARCKKASIPLFICRGAELPDGWKRFS